MEKLRKISGRWDGLLKSPPDERVGMAAEGFCASLVSLLGEDCVSLQERVGR